MSDTFPDLIDAALDERRDAHLLRSRRILEHFDATHVLRDGKRLVNFASNNYLGLTHHPKMLAPFDCAVGAGAAGLISGYTDLHHRAENAIAQWKQTEAALLMPSGYQANLAAIQTLHAISKSQDKPVRFLLDKLIHASLIDAVRQTGAAMRVFAHNDLSKLQRLLDKRDAGTMDMVVTESIYSMDGDAADLRGIASLKSQHDFVWLVDEAHGSGVYGPNGAGVVAEMGLRHAVDISIVTLSKALGASGGAVCASRRMIDAVLNFGRAYIYSTAVSPVTAICAMRAIEIMQNEPQRQQRLREISMRLREGLAASGVAVGSGDSPIIPILLEDENAAIQASQKLEERGLLILAVRPPTVPRGSSRLRITLCCEHTDEEIDHLIKSLAQMVGSSV